jgi:hypothetical protein
VWAGDAADSIGCRAASGSELDGIGTGTVRSLAATAGDVAA